LLPNSLVPRHRKWCSSPVVMREQAESGGRGGREGGRAGKREKHWQPATQKRYQQT
jgi:hypothetical protein